MDVVVLAVGVMSEMGVAIKTRKKNGLHSQEWNNQIQYYGNLLFTVI